MMPVDEALRQLHQKAIALDAYRAAFPDHHGFMPWFDAMEGGKPLEPSLGTRYNGMLGWSLYCAVRTLEEAGQTELAARLNAHLEEMRRWAVRLAYKGGGRVAAQVMVRPRGEEPVRSEQDCEDPFAGELFCLFLDLLADWDDADAAKDERGAIWSSPGRQGWLGTGVVQCRGEGGPAEDIEALMHGTFSVHEEWKYLLLPYSSVPACRRLLHAAERARTWFSRSCGLPGMLGDCHVPEDWDDGDGGPLRYVTAFGIPGPSGLAAEDARQDAIAASGPFGLLLADPAAGAAWLRETLDACAGMQTPWGAAESCRADGAFACPLLTWDTKATMTLAVLGGLGGLMRRHLERDGLFPRFASVLETLYIEFGQAKTPLRGEFVDFAPPPSVSSAALSETSGTCVEREMVKALRGIELPACDERALQALRTWFEGHEEEEDSSAPYCTPRSLEDWCAMGSQRFRASASGREELYAHVVAMHELGVPLALLARQAPRYPLFFDMDLYGGLEGEEGADRVHHVAWGDQRVLLHAVAAAVCHLYPQFQEAGLEVAVFCSSGFCKVHCRYKASYHLVFPEIIVDRPVKAWPGSPHGELPPVHGRHMVARDNLVCSLISESELRGRLAELRAELLECCDERVPDSEDEGQELGEGAADGGGATEDEAPRFLNDWPEIVDDKPLRHEPWPEAFTGFRLPFTDKVAPSTGAFEGRPKVPLGRWRLRVVDSLEALCGGCRLAEERLPDLEPTEWVRLGDISVCADLEPTPWDDNSIYDEAREESHQLFE